MNAVLDKTNKVLAYHITVHLTRTKDQSSSDPRHTFKGILSTLLKLQRKKKQKFTFWQKSSKVCIKANSCGTENMVWHVNFYSISFLLQYPILDSIFLFVVSWGFLDKCNCFCKIALCSYHSHCRLLYIYIPHSIMSCVCVFVAVGVDDILKWTQQNYKSFSSLKRNKREIYVCDLVTQMMWRSSQAPTVIEFACTQSSSCTERDWVVEEPRHQCSVQVFERDEYYISTWKNYLMSFCQLLIPPDRFHWTEVSSKVFCQMRNWSTQYTYLRQRKVKLSQTQIATHLGCYC